MTCKQARPTLGSAEVLAWVENVEGVVKASFYHLLSKSKVQTGQTANWVHSQQRHAFPRKPHQV